MVATETAPPPADRPKSKVFPPSVIPAPKTILPTPVPVLTVESAPSVTPPVPKSAVSLVVIIPPCRVTAALPVNDTPPPKVDWSVAASPSVTFPSSAKSTCTVNVFAAPFRVIVPLLAVVIRSLTVTLPVNVLDAALVRVRSVMLVVVATVIAPPVPAFRPKS